MFAPEKPSFDVDGQYIVKSLCPEESLVKVASLFPFIRRIKEFLLVWRLRVSEQ